MTVLEKVAFLKGLVSGLDIQPESKEGRVYAAMIEVLDDLALSMTDAEDAVAELDEAIGVINDDLESLEEYVFGDDDDDDDDTCSCGDDCDCDDDDCDCDCDDDCDCNDEKCDCCGDTLYEVTCPSCGDQLYLDEDMVSSGSTNCPACGELLEFDDDASDSDKK